MSVHIITIRAGSQVTPRLGVIFTLADLYRKHRPHVSQQFHKRWTARVRECVPQEWQLFIPDVAHVSEEIANAVSRCAHEGCEMVAVIPMAYTASAAVRDGLSDLHSPLLLVSTAWDFRLAHTVSGEDLFANQSLHAIQDSANVLRRTGHPFSIIAGHFEDPRFVQRFVRQLRAGRAASLFHSGTVGQLGGSLEGMLDFAYDPDHIGRACRFEAVNLAATHLIDRAKEVQTAALQSYVEWMNDAFTVDSDVTAAELAVNARYALALETLVSECGFHAMALNFSALLDASAATLPFVGASRLLSRGIGYAGEGDVLTALLTAALHRITSEATFSELYSADYGNDEILLSHMGECNFALARPDLPIRLRPREFPWGDVTRPLAPVFQLKPGRVTLASISSAPSGDRLQLVSIPGQIHETPEHTNLFVPYSRLKLEGPIPHIIEEYSRKGGTHHVVLAYGDTTEDLRAFADYCGMEYQHI